MKVYVSLTSIYDNQTSLLMTLKSIESQTRLPDKCYLYLSEEPYLLDKGFNGKQMNPDLKVYLNNHSTLFEIRWVSNIGPYRKLLPLLSEKMNEDCLIITIDDDTEYNSSLISDYVNDWQVHHCCIAYRGFTMYIGNTMREITYEHRDKLNPKSIYNFHTGKGGVVYHPKFFKKTGNLIFDRNIYRECCETGDDIWFNFMRIANNVDCYVRDYPYMRHDYSTVHSLYGNFNMKNNLNTINIQKTVSKLMDMGVLIDSRTKLVFDSNSYWEDRYKNKGNSGDGSYGDKAIFKGQFLSQLIRNNHIKSIIDYGVGDGNQLKFINTQGTKYIGLDVSETAIQKCRRMFSGDLTKTFIEFKNYDHNVKADLVISSDVIYHLIDDTIYHQYMRNLFTMSRKYVVIHAVDNDYKQAQHVLFRKFTPYVETHYPAWKLTTFVHNSLWVGEAGKMGFYVFEKT